MRLPWVWVNKSARTLKRCLGPSIVGTDSTSNSDYPHGEVLSEAVLKIAFLEIGSAAG